MQHLKMNMDPLLFVVIWCSYAGVGVVGLPIVDLGAVVGVRSVVDIITAVNVHKCFYVQGFVKILHSD